jgi:outer membrane scaffolding protein for murein synthesis (MipA/OmpV family)
MKANQIQSRLSAIAMLAGMLAAPAAHAQFEPPADVGLNVVGVAVGSAPDYSGSSDNRVAIAPILRYQFAGTKRYVSWLGPKLQVNLLNDDGWRFGPMLSFREARDNDVDNRIVRRMEEVDSEVAFGAFVQYNLKLSNRPLHDVAFAVDGAGASNGAFYTARVTWWQPFTPELIGTIGVGTSYGNNKYMRTYYGVTGSDIALFPSLGGNAYNAKSGIVGVNIPVGLTYIMDRRWMLSGGFRYEKLQGDAKDSPIVSQEGDSSQWIYGIGLSYIFGTP